MSEKNEHEQGWLIYKAGRGWYRPDAQGYTNDHRQAGRYSYMDALSYSHPNGSSGPRDEITIRHESDFVERLDKNYLRDLKQSILDCKTLGDFMAVKRTVEMIAESEAAK